MDLSEICHDTIKRELDEGGKMGRGRDRRSHQSKFMLWENIFLTTSGKIAKIKI
jgi:hypothetical protein